MNFITNKISKAEKEINKLKEQRNKEVTERIDNILKENNLSAGIVINKATFKQIQESFLAGSQQITIKYILWENTNNGTI